MKSAIIVIVSAILLITVNGAQDYYWRPFTGEVPEDAFPAAYNFGYNVYIGNAPREDLGLLIGPVLPGIDSITTTGPSDGSVNVLSQYLQVLCAENFNNFQWVATNRDNVNQIGNVVIGGYEDDYRSGAELGVLYIGRVQDGNDYKIGKVVAYHIQDGHEGENMLYVETDRNEEAYRDFEVLTYTN